MSISVKYGQSQVPPGFRFHPTEEELLQYYLTKKVSNEKIDFDVILDVDLNKLEPWDIQEKCRIGTTPQHDWYFFSHKDKKYPTGTRTNRATAAGFWKATGRDKAIYNTSDTRLIGMRKTLVFYKGRAPRGHKSDWIMHEYRLEDNININSTNLHDITSGKEEGWVICRIFKKKNYLKAPYGTLINKSTYRWETNIKCTLDRDHLVSSSSEECSLENNIQNSRFMKRPAGLEITNREEPSTAVMNSLSSSSVYNINDWATFVDGMVTSQHNYCQISGEFFASNMNINHHLLSTMNFPLPLIKPAANEQDEMLDHLWTQI